MEPELDIELLLPTSPPPLEDMLAARRAKRAAILAKYAQPVQSSGTPSSGPVVPIPETPRSTSVGISSALPSGATSVNRPSGGANDDDGMTNYVVRLLWSN